MARPKIVLAFSGGLDTSVAIPWLTERGYDVVALTVDVGQPVDLAAVRAKGIAAGATQAYVVDARKEFAQEFLRRAVHANALYEGVYPLSTALARPLIGRHLVAVARHEGASAIAHGCTGKGNDQVRFDLCTTALAPDLRVVAPAREWSMTREAELEYAQAHGISVPTAGGSPFSTDENLWGRSVECGVLEDPALEPPEEAFGWTTSPQRAPEEPESIRLGFEAGTPVALDDREMEFATLIETLNHRAGGHGIGRIDHVESRVVGIKSREVYECPAALVLIAAHQALEAMVLPRDLLEVKQSLETRYARLVYDGLWYTPLRSSLDAFFAASQGRITGEVVVKLYKGSARVVGRSSPYSLYRPALATYSAGDEFRPEMAEGFIYVWGLAARTWASLEPAAAKLSRPSTSPPIRAA